MCCSLHFQQFLGVPLYWYNKDWYYAWQALAKQMFGLLLVTMQDWWCPMHVRITGDKSVQGQIKQLADGKVQLDFPERVVLISNHQVCLRILFHGHYADQPFYRSIPIGYSCGGLPSQRKCMATSSLF
jgi:hypothetical protein